MDETIAILIDEIYEYCAPRFYDFINGESDEDIHCAELWFETELSHAPSPFMMRIKTPTSVQLDSLCDISNGEQPTKETETTQPTISISSNASKKLDKAADIKEDLNLNSTSERSKDIAIDLGIVAGDHSCVVPSDTVCKEDGSDNNKPITNMKKAPANHEESASSSLQDVCTPNPPTEARKGGSSDLKKQQTARNIASMLKNPSVLKSKMQSHSSSQSRRVKPASVKSDTNNLKNSSMGTPNLVQENQPIKRQKLDVGKSRQILSIKLPSLPHKSRPGVTTSTSKSNATCQTHQEGRKIYVRDREPAAPFVSVAEMMKKFQSSTRDASLSNNSLAHDGGDSSMKGKPRLTLTRPKEPEFETSQRVRSNKVKSLAELEAEMMAKMPKFRARPLNKKIFEGPSLPPLPRSVPPQPEFQEFNLETMERASKNADVSSVVSTESRKSQKSQWKPHYLTEPKTPVLQTSLRARPTTVKSSFEIEQEELEKIPNFKARPLNKKIFESKGEMGLFSNSKKQVTIPQEFHFSIDERIPPPTTSSVCDLFVKLSLCSEPNHGKLVLKKTRPNPFHLHTEERGAEKEKRLLMELIQKQMEEEQARVPKANPYPYTTDFPVIPPKPEPKECTKPEPFQLESLVRHKEETKREMEERQRKEREEARMRIFKAQPVLKEDPIPLPEKERKPLTEVQEFNLHVVHRAVERSEFDRTVKEKEMMYKRYREEADAAKQMEEEKALKQLRRTLVPHANPVPNFANPFIPQKSDKETTKAKSPRLRVLRRKDVKGKSCIKEASSAAAGLMR